MKGLYTKEIEAALLDGSVDLAVHSLKDVGSEIPDGLTLVAFPERQDVRDGLVTANGLSVAKLHEGSRVGTSSVRRRAALLSMRPDLEIVPVRGNVPTRIRKCADGEVDAVVLAMAGLVRLERDTNSVPISVREMVPAPGQGALAIQTRVDGPGFAHASRLDNPRVRAEVEAERRVLALLEGGCQAPIGAVVSRDRDQCELMVSVYSHDGADRLDAVVPFDEQRPVECGVEAAESLIGRGAADIVAAAERWYETQGGSEQ